MESELLSTLVSLEEVLDVVLEQQRLEKRLLQAQHNGEIILSRVLERKLQQFSGEQNEKRNNNRINNLGSNQ